MGLQTAAKAWVAGVVLFIVEYPATGQLVDALASVVAVGPEWLASALSSAVVGGIGAALVWLKSNTQQ